MPNISTFRLTAHCVGNDANYGDASNETCNGGQINANIFSVYFLSTYAVFDYRHAVLLFRHFQRFHPTFFFSAVPASNSMMNSGTNFTFVTQIS